MSAVAYRETLWSGLFPGNQLTMQSLQIAVEKVESSFDLAEAQRKRTLYRLDGGSGTDENLRWLLNRGYQVLATGYFGKRANALAKRVQRWDTYDERSCLGRVTPSLSFGRPIDVLVKKRLTNGAWKYSYYVTTCVFLSKRTFIER